MKKMLLAAIGLTGLLASCGPGIIVEPLPAPPVTITNVSSFESNWYYMDGTTRKYVICRDRETTVTMDVSWTGPLARLDAKFTGTSSGLEKTVSTPVFNRPLTSGSGTFDYTFAAGAAPQSLDIATGSKKLSAQAIVVNPTQPQATLLDVRGVNPDGVPSAWFPVVGGLTVVTCGTF